jgi:hypothetical protein
MWIILWCHYTVVPEKYITGELSKIVLVLQSVLTTHLKDINSGINYLFQKEMLDIQNGKWL